MALKAGSFRGFALALAACIPLTGCGDSAKSPNSPAGQPASPGGAAKTNPAGTAAPQAPTITAAPNPIPAGEGQGSTTLTWTTGDGSLGEVYLRTGNGEDILFAGAAPKGVQAATWIHAGVKYEFILYAGKGERTKELARVSVMKNKN